MRKLADQDCQSCSTASAPLSKNDLAQALMELPEWTALQQPQPMLTRTYNVKDFSEALGLANRIGILANEHNHHPSLIVEWGKITVQWWTHQINNIHQTDAVLAAKTDELFTTSE